MLTGPAGAVIRIFHTPKEKANPGTFRGRRAKTLKTSAESSQIATVKNFSTAECQKRLVLRPAARTTPPGAGSPITVNATSGAKLDTAEAIAASIRGRS